MHGGSIDYGLHVEFLNVLMLPKPADMEESRERLNFMKVTCNIMVYIKFLLSGYSSLMK